MPVSIPFLETSDDYTEACTIGTSQQITAAAFTIANAPVIVQVARQQITGIPVWDITAEEPFAPGSGIFPSGIYGIRFKSAVPGQPAVIAVTAFFIGDAVPIAQTSTVANIQPGGGGETPTSVPVGVNGPGQFNLVPGLAGFVVRLISVGVMGDGNVGVNFSNTIGAALTGVYTLIASTGFVLGPNNDGWFDTDSGDGLDVVLDSAQFLGGVVTYKYVAG